MFYFILSFVSSKDVPNLTYLPTSYTAWCFMSLYIECIPNSLSGTIDGIESRSCTLFLQTPLVKAECHFDCDSI